MSPEEQKLREEQEEIEETDEEFSDEGEEEELDEEELEDGEIDEDDFEDGEFGEFEDGFDLGGLLSATLATEEGDTVCTALLSIGDQLATQNKILLKILTTLSKKAN